MPIFSLRKYKYNIDCNVCRASIKIAAGKYAAKYSHRTLNSINWYVYIYCTHNIELILCVI